MYFLSFSRGWYCSFCSMIFPCKVSCYSVPRQITRLLHGAPASEQPKILGLSASIINKKISPAKLEATIDQLQNSMGCAVSTCHDMDAVSK